MLSSRTFYRYISKLVYPCTYEFWLKDQAKSLNEVLVILHIEQRTLKIYKKKLLRRNKKILLRGPSVLEMADLTVLVGLPNFAHTLFRYLCFLLKVKKAKNNT